MQIRVTYAVENHVIIFVDVAIGSIVAIVIREVDSYTVFHFKSSLHFYPPFRATELQG